MCLIAKISPGPAAVSHKLPVSFLGLQVALIYSSSVDEKIEPIKTEWGVISIPWSDKSKSTLVIPTSHISSWPQNELTSISFISFTIWGNDDKSLESLNNWPLNCDFTPLPILIKSDGLNENSPILDKSKSITIFWLPNGTPTIIKSPESLVLTEYL